MSHVTQAAVAVCKALLQVAPILLTQPDDKVNDKRERERERRGRERENERLT